MQRRLPSPAMIVALIALSLALGGVSYAAVALPKNSVGSREVKNDSLTGKDIKESTLKIKKVSGQVILTGVQFQPRDGTATYGYAGVGAIYGVSGGDLYTAHLDVPVGATITRVTYYVTDSNAANIDGFLTSYRPAASPDITDHTYLSSTGVSGGGTVVSDPLNVKVVKGRDYRLLVGFGANSSNLSFSGAKVDYSYNATLKNRPTTRLKHNVSE